MRIHKKWSLFVGLAISAFTAVGQITVKTTISDDTPITDKATGRQVSFKEYRALTKADEYAYSLDPVYDEYGQASSFKLRPTTAYERSTHMFNYRDSTLRLDAGQKMPLFVMKGPDGKTYRSTDLKGQVVVLSFWTSLNKPYWDSRNAEQYATLVQPYQLVSLGIINNSKTEVADFLTKQQLPFVPIPDSYTFSRKFQIFISPAYVVIDKAGNVAAVIEPADDGELKAILDKVTH